MEKDNIVTIAQKFTEKEKAWMLDQYNKFKGQPVRRGDEVLIPLTNLPLTDAGRAEAAAAEAATRTQAHGATREAQRRVDLDMPVLLADVRGGRYVDAVTLGGRLLGMGPHQSSARLDPSPIDGGVRRARRTGTGRSIVRCMERARPQGAPRSGHAVAEDHERLRQRTTLGRLEHGPTSAREC
jgi:hypothetical protein